MIQWLNQLMCHHQWIFHKGSFASGLECIKCGKLTPGFVRDAGMTTENWWNPFTKDFTKLQKEKK